MSGTGVTHSVREFIDLAFDLAGLDYHKYVTSDPKLYRPAEVEILIGDSTKARNILGWSSCRTFSSLVGEMLEADCRLVGVALPKRSETSASI